MASVVAAFLVVAGQSIACLLNTSSNRNPYWKTAAPTLLWFFCIDHTTISNWTWCLRSPGGRYFAVILSYVLRLMLRGVIVCVTACARMTAYTCLRVGFGLMAASSRMACQTVFALVKLSGP